MYEMRNVGATGSKKEKHYYNIPGCCYLSQPVELNDGKVFFAAQGCRPYEDESKNTAIEIVKTGKGDEGDQTQINDGSAEPVEETVSNAQNLELAKEEKFIKEKNEQDNVIDGNLINPIAGLEALYASSGGGSGSGYQGSTFIETAKNVWEHVVNGNYTYDQSYGKAVPVPEPHIDCSAYVSWALYEYGYDDFGGGQASTVTFMTTDWNAKYGWEVIDVAISV